VVLLLAFIGSGYSALQVADLTHSFDNTTLYWPTAMADRFRFYKKIVHGKGPTFYSMNMFCAAEHGGTHLDAPIHFAEGKKTVGQIHITDLIGNLSVIDVKQKSSTNPDYLIGEPDFIEYEKRNGKINDGSIILLNSGWSKYWPNATLYYGTASNDTTILHFPGLSPAGARWLIDNRKVKAVGIDTASIDYGQSQDFQAHRILMAQNIPVFENVANLDIVPAKGAIVYALPMKIGEGTGAPLRIIATWDDSVKSSGPHISLSFFAILPGILLAFLSS